MRLLVLMIRLGISTLLLAGCQSGRVTEVDHVSYEGDKFQAHIRTTEARTPEQERLGFRLPEGFKIELFASEPDIGKPMNIAFDTQGRLWVSQSFEYPFPAEPGKGSDRISVLEDTNGDGRADKFIHYEDTLNIPIGLLPLADQTLAYSIPNLYRFQDTNGDTQADRSEVVLGEFGHQDTHGMVNNLTRGYDGWVYTCHGFTNTSTIAGGDGDSISMTSGNTFRFLPDGSRVEQTSYGQVNPFGLAFDEWGYLYSTDCHTSPIYQLIRGADYPHFGKKEVGIGFAPDTKPMGEESTALAGLVYYGASQFPEEYQRNFYIGDVVTCRIHRNSFRFEGSTPVAQAEEDLVKSDDPWFRPVDIKLGPDGALYVADFYNSIIGHYEVPLDHPKRDKIRGRIWRITYEDSEKTNHPDLSTASVEKLIEALNHENILVRMGAADELVDRVGEEAVRPVAVILNQNSIHENLHTLALWVLHRLHALDDKQLRAAANDENPIVRTHTLRILREVDDGDQLYFKVVMESLADSNPHVRRAAVEAAGNYSSLETVNRLVAVKERVADSDTHLMYTLRLTLRNLLREESVAQQVVAQKWSDEENQALADVMTGVESTVAGEYLLNYLEASDADPNRLASQLQHTVRFVPAPKIEETIRLARQRTGDDLMLGMQVFKAMEAGIEQRGKQPTEFFSEWATPLAKRVLDQAQPAQGPTDENVEREQMLTQAMDIVGTYHLTNLAAAIYEFIEDPTVTPKQQAVAAKTLLQLNPLEYSSQVSELLRDEGFSNDGKRELINSLGELPEETTINVLANIGSLPPDLQRDVALTLAAGSATRDELFRKVRQGEIFVRALITPTVKERLLLDISPAQLATFEQLTANVSSVDEARNELIQTRLANFLAADSLMSSGVIVFNRNCKACHRISNEGSMIGPQLTGIGSWGAEALATKILDPNRNISEAFRTYTIKTKDGQVKTGLYRREEGEVLVFANMSGEEFSVPKDNIAEQKASEYTLMPDHFGEQLSQNDFNALLSYLLGLQS